MKVFKHMTALVLALVMAAALAVTAYAASVTVKYRVYVYSDEITFRQYDYSQSTTPSITNLTISATSSLGSGSALYHMKYADGAVAYCIEPGVHSDDSGTYKEGSSASWYNLPASVQSGIALAMSLGYPSADYGAVPGDRNSSAIINADIDFYEPLMKVNRSSSLIAKVSEMLKQKVRESYAAFSGVGEETFNIMVDFTFSGLFSVYQSWFNSERRQSLGEISHTLSTLCFEGINGLKRETGTETQGGRA